MKSSLFASETHSISQPPDNVQLTPVNEIGLPESGRLEGQAARAIGLEVTENPYRRVEPEDVERFKPLAEEWEAGWNEAQNPRDLPIEYCEVDCPAPNHSHQRKHSETSGDTWAVIPFRSE